LLRDIGVGTQSTIGGHKIFAQKISIKNQQNARILHDMPEFYVILAQKIIKIPDFMIFARKIYKIPEFYWISCPKMPEFYIKIARKIFFPEF